MSCPVCLKDARKFLKPSAFFLVKSFFNPCRIILFITFKLGTYKLYSIISDENLRNAKPSEDIFNFRKAKASEDIFSYERDCLLSSDKLNRLYLYIFAKMVHR